MKFQNVIGLDMGKQTFVFAIHNTDVIQEVSNTAKGIRKMLKTLKKMLVSDLSDCLFCMEHTGLYSLVMMQELENHCCKYAVIPGLEIKRSLGISRGKSDTIDARKIAEYAYLRKERIPLFKRCPESISKLQDLISLREMLVRHRSSLIVRLNEEERIKPKNEYKNLFAIQNRLIKKFDKEIDNVESLIQQAIENDPDIKEYFELLQSIVGVGPVLATYVICKTACFTKFPNWRKFACYCGTAPFPNESGKTKNGWKISELGDKKMKSLLTLAARSAMLYDPEIKLFALRKQKTEPIPKKVVNAVRNKLLARIFSVAKRKTPYVKLSRFAA